MIKAPEKAIADHIARKEREIARLAANHWQLVELMQQKARELAALKTGMASAALLPAIDGEGDEANGAALWH